MTARSAVVVSDSTPLIHLSRIGDLALVRELFGSVLIPPAVKQEVVVEDRDRSGVASIEAALGSWIHVSDPIESIRSTALTGRERLDLGEIETVLLAKDIQADAVLIDDQRAVNYARAEGLVVVRTASLYVAAKSAGLINAVRPKLDALRAAGFWLADRDYEAVLSRAGEFR